MRHGTTLAVLVTLGSAAGAHAAVDSLTLDLARPAGDGVVEIEVKDRQAFRVEFLNYAPSAVYRVRQDWQLSPDRDSRPGGAGRHEYSSYPPPTLGRWSACPALTAALQEYLQLTEEDGAATRAAEIRDQPWEGCAAQQRQIYLDMAMRKWELPTTYELEPGDRLEVTVERVDGETRRTLRTWRFAFRVPPPWTWPYATESEWIATEVVADIAEMAAYAAARRGTRPAAVSVRLRPDPSAEDLRYTATVALPEGPPVEGRIEVVAGIWNPAAYGQVAGAIVRRFGLKGHAGGSDSAAERLLEPTFPVLEDENGRVSRLLEEDMTRVAGHEQAALLLGALGLREAAAEFSDTRAIASRMTAHLAFAAALRSRADPGVERQIAEAALATLASRQVDAVERASRLPETGAAGAWRRALVVRNTGDWRVLEAPAKASLLERREHYRALGRSLGTIESTAFLQEFEPEPVPDWWRLAFDGYLPDVGTGNLFSAVAIDEELAEIDRLWARLQPGLEVQLVALNGDAGRCVDPRRRPSPVRIIDWGAWAGSSRRHLLNALSSRSAHMKTNLGLKKEADEFRDQARDPFAAIDLFATLAATWKERPDPAGCRDSTRLIQQGPHRVPALWWSFVVTRCRAGGALPRPERWMNPPLLPGTAYDAARRWPHLFASPESEAPDTLRSPAFQEARRLARYEERLALRESSARKRAGETRLDLAALWGPLAEYNLTAMREIAETVTAGTPEHRKLYEHLTRVNPDSFLALGWDLRQAGLDDEAAIAYQQAYEKAPDRVSVSHHMGWLADYHFDRGRRERAFEIAGAAAETYSGAGLIAQARMLERSGRFEEAESWYKRVAERYEVNRDWLDCFYIRRLRRSGEERAYERQAAEAVTRLFPMGLARVSLSDLAPPPAGGPLLPASEDDQRGLRKGDFIAAIDGYRVRSLEQQTCVSSWTDSLETTAIVWRDGGYEEVAGRYRYRFKYGP
jgi:tetratricopeptide (TPR) repeat protein